MAASDCHRLFFALWPGPAVAARLAQLALTAQARCGGRMMRPATLHLTLAFIGDVAETRIENLRRAASLVTGEAFTLSLDRFGCWRRNRIVWAGCSDPPPQLAALAGQLAQRLSAGGFALELRAFAAHLTLLRNARCLSLPGFEAVSWPVGEFVLAESGRSAQGAGYALIGRWPLAGGGNCWHCPPPRSPDRHCL